MMLPLLGAATSAAGLAAYGTYYHNSSLFGVVLASLPARDGTVALTFDDGPNPDATPRILDVLAQHGVRATFFILGRHAERWPELVRRVASEGHQIGNHGFAHRKLHVRPPSYIREDLRAGTRAIEAAGGGSPRWFRAPHGFRNPWVVPAARALGQRTVGWTLGVWDSARPGAGVITQRAVTKSRAGTILLLHDGDGYDPDGDRLQTAEALPGIIDGIRRRGFAFASLPELTT